MPDRVLALWARAMVALYPRDFRRAAGLDLGRLLSDEGRSARRRGRGRLLGFVARNTIICLRDALLERGAVAWRWTRTMGEGGMRGMSPGTWRHAVRGLLRRPGYTVPALLTLALGIGATTAMFSVLYGVVLRPLPYTSPERIFEVSAAHRENAFRTLSAPDVADWADRARTMEALGGYTTLPSDLILTGQGDAVEVETAYVTPGFFESFAVRPRLGRFFTREDDRTDNRVVVVSHAFWSDALGTDPDATGRVLTLNGEGYRVLGVMPPSFDFPTPDVEAWVLLSVIPPASAPWDERWLRLLNGVGRLAEGRDVRAAEEELGGIARSLAREFPETNESIIGASLRPLHEGLVGDVSTALRILMGAAALVLVLVCANVANLALARQAGRAPDLAVRAALGESRSRRIGLVVSESLVLAVVGGALGLALATWGTELLLSRSAGALPRAHAVDPDWRMAAFALVASLVSGLAFGLLPSLRAARIELAQRLSGAGRGGGAPRMKAALVVSQMALSVVLLVGATLLLRSLWSLSRVDPGFDAEELVVAHMTFPASRFPDRTDYLARYEETLAGLAAIPGVSAAGAIRWFPFLGEGEDIRWTIPGEPAGPEEGQDGLFLQVSPGLFQTMGVDFLAGTGFGPESGRDGRSVAVVSQALARRAFGSGPAVGRTLAISADAHLEVVGVVEDVRQVELDVEPPAIMYVPQHWSPRRGASFVVRAEAEAGTIMQAVRDVVRSQDPGQPITVLAPASDLVRGQTARPGFYARLLGAFAALAVVLSAIGVYGVVAFGVTQRRREVGIRMAMGADAARVRSLVVRQGMAPVLVGLGIGLVGALAGARVLDSLLFGVEPFEPSTYGFVPALLALVGAAACYLPARSASSTDPVEALSPE